MTSLRSYGTIFMTLACRCALPPPLRVFTIHRAHVASNLTPRLWFAQGYCKETADPPGYRPAFYKAEHSDTAFHVDKAIEYFKVMRRRRSAIIGAPGWAMHLSILRPHTPWLCPEPYNRMYPPEMLDGMSPGTQTQENQPTYHR